MAGTHIFTSSAWIQSGSAAEFKTGLIISSSLNVDGDINATTFIGDGSGLTGIFEQDFYTGKQSALDLDPPQSIDTYVQLVSGQQTASKSDIEIHTTSSDNFAPNYYAFYKLIENGFTRLQVGAQSYYTGSDGATVPDLTGVDPYENDLAPGTHRYMVYAADTAIGIAKNLFTSITIYGFINVDPVVNLTSALPIIINHDEITGSVVLDFSTTSDLNITADEATSDFLRGINAFMTSDQHVSSNQHRFSSTIDHNNDTENTTQITYETQAPGLSYNSLTSDQLHVTMSVSAYNTIDTSNNIISNDTATYVNEYTVEVFDDNPNGTGSLAVNVAITPPATASISNITLSLNEDAYTGNEVETINVDMMYDNYTTATTTSSLANRYTSSLVRLKVGATITEPNGYTAVAGHDTEIKILDDGTSTIYTHADTVGIYKIIGSNAIATEFGNAFGTTAVIGLDDFVNIPLQTGTHNIGTVSGVTDINNLDDGVRHGTHNHHHATPSNVVQVIVNPIEDIEVSNINIELESAYLSDSPTSSRTARILYGYNGTLQPSDISALEAHDNFKQEHKDESVVRYRISATITEPKGPSHMDTTVEFTDAGNTIETIILNKTSSHVASGTSPTYESDKLVVHYTSSWTESVFVAGNHTITANITTAAQNTGINVGVISPATISVLSVNATVINESIVEVETTSYLSGNGGSDRTAKLMYGYGSSILESGLTSLYAEPNYAQIHKDEAVVRYRLKSKITEPFGPKHDYITSQFTDDSSNLVSISVNKDTFDGTASSIYDGTDQRVTTYTSSWQESTFNVGSRTISSDLSGNNLSNAVVAIASAALTMSAHDELEITDSTVEVEATSYGSGIGAATRTARILYGFNASLLTTEEDTLIAMPYYQAQHLDEAIIQYRITSTTTEPFGPKANTTSIQFTDNSSNIASLTLATASAATSEYVSGRLVSTYTSSSNDSAFNANSHTLSANITSGTTISGSPSITPATLTMLSLQKTLITNPIVEVETSNYLSDTGGSSRSAQVMYGYNSSLLETDVATLQGLTNYVQAHLDESVIRYRLTATVTEPFGPTHNAMSSLFRNGNTNLTTISLSNSSNPTPVSAYDANISLVTSYTSSWQESTFVAGTHTISTILYGTNITNNFSATTAELIMAPIADTIITAQSMVEQNTSGSNIATTTRTSKLLHGLTTTQLVAITGTTQIAQDQLVRTQFMVNRIEPFGPHTESTVYSYDGTTYTINRSTVQTESMDAGRWNTTFTSSWIPFEFVLSGNTFVPVFTSHDSITNGTNISETISSATVTVQAADNSEIDASLTPNIAHYSASAGIVMLDDYISSGHSDVITNVELHTTIVADPMTTSSYDTMNASNYDVVWTHNGGSDIVTLGSGKTIAYIDISDISNNNNIASYNITATIDSNIVNDSEQEVVTQVINILPNKPTSIHGESFTDNISLQTAQLPSESTWTYKSGDLPGDSVSNILKTAGTNYGITLTMPGKLYDYAESGSIKLYINSAEVSSIDLNATFNDSLKATTQAVQTSGVLSITRGVHNNISQPVYDGTELYPVGYQHYSPTIAITSKYVPGYNELYLERTIGGVTQTSAVYGWYYDDGDHTVTINQPATNAFTWNEYNSTSPTMSLSGVDYFIPDVPFEISYSGYITGVANETYNVTSGRFGTIDTETGLKIYVNGSYTDYSRYLTHNDGLTWSNSTNDIPTVSDTANLSYLAQFTGTNTTGTNRSATVVFNDGGGSETITPIIGRYVDNGSHSPSSTTTENFYSEEFRLAKSQTSSFSDHLGAGNYAYWTTAANCAYDSTVDISTTDDLQQNTSGQLTYPTQDYSSGINPNAPDYTNSVGDRFYYRAINVQNISSTQHKVIKLHIGCDPNDPITSEDIWADQPIADGDSVHFNSRKIRIRARLPGAINSTNSQLPTKSGTNWSVVTAGTGLSTAPSVENWVDLSTAAFYPVGHAQATSTSVAILWSTKNYAVYYTDSIVLLEIRLAADATESNHNITYITMEKE